MLFFLSRSINCSTLTAPSAFTIKSAAGHQFLHFVFSHIENCSDGRTFRSCNNHFVAYIIICRTNTVCVAEYKRIAITNETANSKTAVEQRH